MTNPLHTFEREVRVLTKRFALVPNLVLRTVSSSERAELELFDGARVVARLVVHTSTTEPPPPATQPVLPGVSVAVPGVRPTPAETVTPATDDLDAGDVVTLRATKTMMRDLWRPDDAAIAVHREDTAPWVAWGRAEDLHTWRTVVPRPEAVRILKAHPGLELGPQAGLPHHLVHRDQEVLCVGGYDAAPFYDVPGVVYDVRRVAVTDLARMPGERAMLCAIVSLASGATWCAPLDRAVVAEDDHDFRLSLWQPVTEEEGAWVVPAPFEPPPKKAKKTATTKAAKTKNPSVFSYGIAKGIEDATRAEVVAIVGELVTLGAHPTTTFDWTPRLDGGTDANKKMFGLVNSLEPSIFNNGYFEERQLDPDADGIFARCWHTQCRSRNLRQDDLGPGLYCAPCAQAVREGRQPRKTKATAKTKEKATETARRVWIRETAWDALDPATQAALTEPVTGSSIAWEGREGAITAVLPEGALLQSLAHLARSLDVTLFYGETPPPAEVAAVAPDVTVIYREKAHAFDHLAKRAEVACLILTDSNGTRENKRPKKRTEAQWTQDIGELLSGACILEIARLYSQRGVCLWDSRDGDRP